MAQTKLYALVFGALVSASYQGSGLVETVVLSMGFLSPILFFLNILFTLQLVTLSLYLRHYLSTGGGL